MKTFNFFLLPPLLFLFLLFFKIGLIFVGGGYVLIPIFHRELVTNLHFLTERQFIDGVVISQLTPGPISIFVAFAGYCIAGVWGALLAAFALFLPGGALTIFLSKNYGKIRNSPLFRELPDTLTPVIIGLLISTVWQMKKNTITDKFDTPEIILALFLILRFKVNPLLIIILYMIGYLVF